MYQMNYFALNSDSSDLIQYLQHLKSTAASPWETPCQWNFTEPCIKQLFLFIAHWECPESFANIMTATTFMQWKNYFTFHQLI